MSAFDNLVGIPWCAGGRTRDGADCLGLVQIAYRELLAIELPEHPNAHPADHDAVRREVATAKETWTRIEDPQPFDVVLLRERPWHLGLVVGRSLMLHMPEGLSSKVESFATGRHAARIEGFYRHSDRVPA